MTRPHASRVAVVTGASRGLGAAIAERLAAEGALVGLVARGAEALEARVGAIEDAGGRAAALVADVADIEASRAAFDAFVAAHGAPDILVNNAGGNIRKAAADYTPEEWDQLLRLGLSAPFHWSVRCGAAMRERGWGRIVNVGSVAGMTALPTGAPYAAAKAGLAALTRNLAREWGGDGVTVNLVAPWYVPTPLTEGVLAQPAFHDAVLAATPTGRLGTPEEIAAAVSFLCGAEAAWINGVCLPLDGGFTAASFYP